MKKLIPLIALAATIATPALAQTSSYRADQSAPAYRDAQDDIVVIIRGKVLSQDPDERSGIRTAAEEAPGP